MDFKSTLHLPDAEATIPMKANLPTLEPSIHAIWESEAIYHKLQEARKDAPSYVLHDGPPYTNSPIHIGTAMNKILKDFVLKSRQMMGFRTPYVPGFDNHGLPIEQAVMKKFAEKKVTPTIPELRQACRDHAAEYLAIQRDQFKRLGIFGLWEKPYTTMDFRFEAEIVRVFRRLVEKGYVYKGLRPTLWSPTSRTALADTEIEYHDHVSKAIYVRFPLKSDPNQELAGFENVYTVIWTTTPWTIPANLACAFHPEFNYDVVKVGNDHYILLQDLVAKVAEKVGWVDYSVVKTLEGINFDKMEFKHPIFDRSSVAVMAEYVTTEDGTGVVHTAPSHGRDDFFTGQKYNLGVPNTVDERGVLTHEAGEFEGVFYKNCDTVVVERLQEVGALLSVSDYSHSYPYAERDGQPVIFRATEQWFLSLEHEDLRKRMLNSIQEVNWVPSQGQNRIEAMIRNRPDWCISRQRPWGVGIPVFYGRKSRVPVLDPVAIDAVANLVEQEGSDAWFIKEAWEILPKGYTHPETGETEFDKETDVLDVWFDSGSTSLAVLEGNVYPEWKENWPADIYLEGSDQHRGWFNTSLILGQATRNGAPYKTVLTHGFVTDGEGRKMSKRLGNVVDPVKACADYGADVVRYWVAGTDYSKDVPCSDAILKQFGERYRGIRNSLRFLLGNLKGFELSQMPGNFHELDHWLAYQFEYLMDECILAYERFDFGFVANAMDNFCKFQLSSVYLDLVKDRLYCDGATSTCRLSAQKTSFKLAAGLIHLMAPLLPHTAEESFTKLRVHVEFECESIFESVFPSMLTRSSLAIIGIRDSQPFRINHFLRGVMYQIAEHQARTAEIFRDPRAPSAPPRASSPSLSDMRIDWSLIRGLEPTDFERELVELVFDARVLSIANFFKKLDEASIDQVLIQATEKRDNGDFDRLEGSTLLQAHYQEYVKKAPEGLRELEETLGFDSYAEFVLQFRMQFVFALMKHISLSQAQNPDMAGVDLRKVVVKAPVDDYARVVLKTFLPSELATYLRCSWVDFLPVGDEFQLEVSPYNECIRSRVRRPDVAEVEVDGETVFLSARDRKVLGL